MNIHTKISDQRNQIGFTLIELLIVVAIIGILGGIAYPSYREHVIKSNRSAAKSYMVSLSSRQEQVMLDRRLYSDAANNAAMPAAPGLLSVPSEVVNLYEFSVVANNAATPPTFTISAAPKAGTIQSSDPTLTLDSTGAKGPPGHYW